MADIGGFIGDLWQKVTALLGPVIEWVQATNIPDQIGDVDYIGLFTNPWFMVPFVVFIGYQVYKQAWRDVIIVALICGVWILTGTQYMQTLVVGDELQVKKVLPVLFGGAAVLGLIIYLIFGRSD